VSESNPIANEHTGFPTVGILGAGQLGRMLGLAALRLGVAVKYLDRADSGATRGLGQTTIGDWTDPETLRAFAADCDALTTENEWAPMAALESVVGGRLPVRPGARALARIADKVEQKRALEAAGLAVAPWAHAGDERQAREALERLGYPAVFKRIVGSYDGYGNATVQSPDDVNDAFTRLSGPRGILVEGWVPYERELAVLVARGHDGETAVYPVTHTEQRDHRCHAVLIPSGLSTSSENRARDLARAAVAALEIVGIAGVELFFEAGGQLRVNEVAPRPHNTGHYTIEACHTSQFENHLRAVLGWPLGDPGLRAPATAMVNVLGVRDGRSTADSLAAALDVSGVAVHVYGKREVRKNRKMGHVTALGADLEEVRARAERAAAQIRL